MTNQYKDNTLRDDIENIISDCYTDLPNRMETNVEAIEALLAEEVRMARINELGRAYHHLLIQYGKSLYYDERMAELEKGSDG
jgi:hypothetical protein